MDSTAKPQKQRLTKPEHAKAPPTPVPARPPEPPAGPRFGTLTVLGFDSSGKRARTLCVCGALREVSAEGLQNGSVRSCGDCRRQPDASRDFATDVAHLESRVAQKRHRGRS
jgi:hypothetical protein